VLRDLPLPSHERIITSWGSGEDAALWTIDPERAGILTVDFITPVSDDPLTWGRIAATNSLSDVFAMGGKPFVALNIVGFPTKTLELDVLKDVLRGGQEKVAEAGAFLLGGHIVEDREPKFGLVVYGEVRRDSIWKVTGARPGDLLLLTKPVGTGIVATAVKADMVEDEASRIEAARWMTTLNDLPRLLSADECRVVHACTDVTGFGLAGHVLDMLSEGGLKLTLGIRDIPLLPGVLDLASSGPHREMRMSLMLFMKKPPFSEMMMRFIPENSQQPTCSCAPEKCAQGKNNVLHSRDNFSLQPTGRLLFLSFRPLRRTRR